jgi:peroxiredoxin
MANPLTGDFDIVAEFSINAANRVLATMHRSERFPHTLTLRVDDTPERILKEQAVLAIVDRYGRAVTSSPVIQGRADLARDFLRPVGGPDRLVNDRPRNFGRIGEHAEVSRLQGWAYLQLSTPTLFLPDASGTRATVHLSMMAKFDADDPNSSHVPRFLRGEIRMAVVIDKVISQIGEELHVSVDSNNVQVDFVPAWAAMSPSGPPVALGDPAKRLIKLAIKNAILTGFEPYNVVLAESGGVVQVRALPGGPAVALMLGITNWDGDPASVANIFLGGGDDFALAASADFIVGKFSEFQDQIKAIKIAYKSTLADYDVTIGTVTVELQNGQILVTGHGYAHTESNFDDFSFIVRQALKLELIDAAGDMSGPVCTAQLAFVGDMSLEIEVGGIASAIVDAFQHGEILNRLRKQRNDKIALLQPTVRAMFDASKTIGGFLAELMKGKSKTGTPPADKAILAYHGVDITPSGVVLHGSLGVPEWPRVHAEIAATDSEYTALNSWIPGGTIQDYTWAPQWEAALPTDPNTFVMLRTPADAGKRMCVTVAGTRIPASGPVPHPLPRASGQTCNWLRLPLTGRFEQAANAGDPFPLVAVVGGTARGELKVVGHASPWVARGNGGVNLIVHFPDERSPADLDALRRALLESGRTDADAAILVVTDPDRFETQRARRVVFTDDPDGAWLRMMKAKRRPATFLLTSAGSVVWSQYGEVSFRRLAEALRTYLLPSNGPASQVLETHVQVGQPPPNFVFESAPGRELLLRKLIGQPVTLVFWKSAFEPCVELLRQFESAIDNSRRGRHAVLAISADDAPELARETGARYAPSAIVVPDPKRQISIAYGVNIWPTTVFIDASGIVSDIQYGAFSLPATKRPTEAKQAAAE